MNEQFFYSCGRTSQKYLKEFRSPTEAFFFSFCYFSKCAQLPKQINITLSCTLPSERSKKKRCLSRSLRLLLSISEPFYTATSVYLANMAVLKL